MKVVNDILDLTRLETGQIELLREPVNIRHVCDRAEVVLRRPGRMNAFTINMKNELVDVIGFDQAAIGKARAACLEVSEIAEVGELDLAFEQASQLASADPSHSFVSLTVPGASLVRGRDYVVYGQFSSVPTIYWGLPGYPNALAYSLFNAVTWLTLRVRSAADLNHDGSVGAPDLASLLSNWGSAGESDLNGDGIPDVKDKCPNEPEDIEGFEDDDGCPEPDTDGDAVIDALRPGQSERFHPGEAVLRMAGRAWEVRLHSQGAPEEFSAFARPGVTLFLDTDPMKSLADLIDADIAILSRGSFSYAAGVLTEGIVIADPYYPPQDGWLVCDESGAFDAAALLDRLR